MSKWKWNFVLVRIFVVVFNEKDILFWILEYYCMWPDRPQHMVLWVIEKTLCGPLRFVFEYPWHNIFRWVTSAQCSRASESSKCVCYVKTLSLMSTQRTCFKSTNTPAFCRNVVQCAMTSHVHWWSLMKRWAETKLCTHKKDKKLM